MNGCKTVIILGAGASAGAENSSTPITSEFFKRAEEIGLTNHKLFIWLLTHIHNFYGISKEDLILGHIDLEEIMSMLDLTQPGSILSNIVWDLIKDKSDKTVEEDIYAAPGILRRIIISILRRTGGDFKCKYHNILCDNLDQNDSIISFNYDLYIDEALKQTDKWDEYDGYGIVPKGISKNGQWISDPPNITSLWKLYKMHGSMNWVRPRYEDNSDEYADELLKREAHLFFLDKEALREGKIKYPNCATEEFMNFQIIPPMIKKTYYPQYYKTIWTKAFDALIKCNHMIIIGFSLRPADIEAKWLLAVSRNHADNHLERLDIVDPQADQLESRFSMILNPRMTVKWKNLADYVDNLSASR